MGENNIMEKIKKTKICIAIVTNRNVKSKTVKALADVIAHTQLPIETVVATEGYTIAENRTYCVIQALNAECSHILFLDDDMIFPKDTIEKLMAHEKEIVGVASNSRMLPLTPTVAFLGQAEKPVKWADLEKQEMPIDLFKCYSIGLGVALIDLDIFNKIGKPWFKFDTSIVGQVTVGEDEWLCNQARAKGIDVWCDPQLPVSHIGDFLY